MRSSLVHGGLALLAAFATLTSDAAAQSQPLRKIRASIPYRASSGQSRLRAPGAPGPVLQAQTNRSAGRIIATHTAVRAGAGLLIGLALKGASVSNDERSVVVTWTALGAGAGLVSGVITWLIGRRE